MKYAIVAITALAVVLAAAVTMAYGAPAVRAQSSLPTPGNFTVVNGPNPGEAIGSWNAVSGAAYYRVGWIAADDALQAFADKTDIFNHYAFADISGATSYTVTGLKPGKEYYFTIASLRERFGSAGSADVVTLTLNDDTSACPTVEGRAYLYEPIQPPMAPAYMDWRWDPGQGGLRELVTDFTIHNDVGDWSDQHGYYLILLQNRLSDAGFYFGVQTNAQGRGKGVIFSRWETDDLANARWDETNGWYELGEHEGGFLGVRRSYDWSAGDYRIRIGPDGLDSDGEWFGLWITDLATDEITWVGSLKFPLQNGTTTFQPRASATIELYGVPRIRPIDVPVWRVSVKPPMGDGVQATWGFTSYPWDDSANALFNSNVRYDHDEGVAHLLVGGVTERENAAVSRIDFKPLATLANLKNGAWLEQNKPALANQLKALPWIADGVDDSEREAAELLIAVAYRHPDVFDALLQKPWVLDSITEHETIVIWGVRWTARESTALADTMLAKSWVQDGISRDEATVVKRLYSIARAEDDSLQQEVIRKVIEILDMPFLDTVESPDAMAVRSLERFEDAGSAEFLEMMTHPTISDGIDDEEAKIITVLGDTKRYKPQLVPVLLDGTSVFKEERTITLPHSGEVLLAIIRFRNHTNPNMDYLEHVVRHHERFMGEPLPTNYIAWYFVDYVSGGHNAGTHMASNPERDPAVGEYWRAPRHAAHEVGHYYWRNSEAWISEGGADLLVILSENARVGRPLVHNREQCTLFNTISEIADAEKRSDEYTCSYPLGQRLFLDLYLTLGEATFRPAFHSLYLKRLRDDPTDDCEGTDLGLCHLEAAFKDGASDEVVVKVDDIIAHWYYGRTGTHEGDRAELAALYHEMGGDNWTNSANWLSNAHIGEWYGVATDAEGRVIELDLSENGLSGELPSRLGNLANLREVLLNDNRLNGPIPENLGSLANLTKLELYDNRLTGAMPAALGNLANLTWLGLGGNKLTGTVPSSLGDLVHLTLLELHGNGLTGEIPFSLGNLTALRYLRLAHGNQLTGCVPVGLADVGDNDLADLGLPFC